MVSPGKGDAEEINLRPKALTKIQINNPNPTCRISWLTANRFKQQLWRCASPP